MDFFRQGRRDGGSFDSGIDLALRRVLASPKFIFRVEQRPRGRSGWRRLSRIRRRPGVAAVVLPLEQHSGRRAAGRGVASHAEGAGHARAAGAAHARGPARRSRSSTTSSASGCSCATCKSKQPNSHEFPDFDDNLRQALYTEMELFFGSIIREDRSVLDLMNGRLHVRQRTAGQTLRHPVCLRQPLPPRDASRRDAKGPARQGRGPAGDVASASHVAGGPRQVGAREHPRRPAAAAPRRGSAVRGRNRKRPGPGQCGSGWRCTAATRPAPAVTG